MPTLVPSPQQRKVFNESNISSFTLFYISWVTYGKQVNTSKDYHIDQHQIAM